MIMKDKFQDSSNCKEINPINASKERIIEVTHWVDNGK